MRSAAIKALFRIAIRSNTIPIVFVKRTACQRCAFMFYQSGFRDREFHSSSFLSFPREAPKLRQVRKKIEKSRDADEKDPSGIDNMSEKELLDALTAVRYPYVQFVCVGR